MVDKQLIIQALLLYFTFVGSTTMAGWMACLIFRRWLEVVKSNRQITALRLAHLNKTPWFMEVGK